MNRILFVVILIIGCLGFSTISYGQDNTTSYSVNIAWGDMEYTYTGYKGWDASKHQYDMSGGKWVETTPGSSGLIQIENSSNVDVIVGASFDANKNAHNNGNNALENMTSNVTADIYASVNEVGSNSSSSSKF